MNHRPQGFFLRLCERAFLLQCRWSERFADKPVPLGRHAGGAPALPWAMHRIAPDVDIVRGPRDGAQIAADLQVLWARAGVSRAQQRSLTVMIPALVGGVALLGLWIRVLIDLLQGRIHAGTIVVFLILLYGVAFIVFFSMAMVGTYEYVTRAMGDWAQLLGGSSGMDNVEPAVDWIARHWPWPTPPAFLAGDNAWARGSRHGRPLLIVAERMWSGLVAADIWFRPRHHRTLPRLPGEILSRLNIFIGGATLRRDPEAQAIVRELSEWGYGVVPTPFGVYAYSAVYERALKPDPLLAVVDKLIAATTSPQS